MRDLTLMPTHVITSVQIDADPVTRATWLAETLATQRRCMAERRDRMLMRCLAPLVVPVPPSRRLLDILADRHLTNHELAVRAAMSDQQIGKLLHGQRRHPRTITCLRIARALNLPLDAIQWPNDEDGGDTA